MRYQRGEAGSGGEGIAWRFSVCLLAKTVGSGLVDAVLIATRIISIRRLPWPPFKESTHVLTEKPAGVYTRQVEQMDEAARRSGKVYGIMFNRTNPLYRQARAVVRRGLGRRSGWYGLLQLYRTQAYYDSSGWRAAWSGEGGGVLITRHRTIWIYGSGFSVCPSVCGHPVTRANIIILKWKTRRIYAGMKTELPPRF